MPNCAVKGCMNNSSQKKPNLKFYRFPKQEDMRKKWFAACGKSTRLDLKQPTVCSLHFQKRCFTLQDRLGFGMKTGRNLLPEAVPTKNLPLEVEQESLLERDIVAKTEAAACLTLQNNTPCNKACGKCCMDKGAWRPRLIELEMKTEKFQSLEKSLRRENESLSRKIKELEERMVKHNEMSQSFSKLQLEDALKEILSQVFTPGQIKCLITKKKKITWTPEDITAAISLRSVSMEAYKYLKYKLNYPLPGLSTLRKWVNQMSNDDSPR